MLFRLLSLIENLCIKESHRALNCDELVIDDHRMSASKHFTPAFGLKKAPTQLPYSPYLIGYRLPIALHLASWDHGRELSTAVQQLQDKFMLLRPWWYLFMAVWKKDGGKLQYNFAEGPSSCACTSWLRTWFCVQNATKIKLWPLCSSLAKSADRSSKTCCFEPSETSALRPRHGEVLEHCAPMDKIRQNANLITQVAKTESNESTRHEERSRLKKSCRYRIVKRVGNLGVAQFTTPFPFWKNPCHAPVTYILHSLQVVEKNTNTAFSCNPLTKFQSGGRPRFLVLVSDTTYCGYFG